MNTTRANIQLPVEKTMWVEKQTAFRPVISGEEEDFFVVEREGVYYIVVGAFWGNIGDSYEKIHIAVSVAKMPKNVFYEAQCSHHEEQKFFVRGKQKEMYVTFI